MKWDAKSYLVNQRGRKNHKKQETGADANIDMLKAMLNYVNDMKKK